VLNLVCSLSDDEEVDDAITRQRQRVIGSTIRRRSIPVYNKKNQRRTRDNEELSDDSGSVMSLHRDPLHRGAHSMLTWRQPTAANRLPSAAPDPNNNNNGTLNAPLRSYSLVRFINLHQNGPGPTT